MTAISNGGAAQRVKVLTDADLKANGGDYYLEGRPPVAVYGVVDAETQAQGGQFAVMGNIAQAVYVVDAPVGLIESNVPIPMIGVDSGLVAGLSAIPVYVMGGSLGGLPAPTNLELTITGAGLDVITAAWDAVAGASDYEIEYSDDGVTYVPVDATALLTYDLTNTDYDPDAVTHYVRVRATGGSDWATVSISGLLVNLAAYWRMNEASGNRADEIGSTTLTESSGTVNSTAGLLGNAAVLVAGGAFLEAATNSVIELGDIDWTVACFVEPNTTVATDGIWGKGVFDTTTEWGVLLVADTTAFFQLFVGTSATSNNLPDGTVTENDWNHIVAWHSATTNEMGISANGGAASTQATTNPAVVSTGNLFIGRAVTNTGDFNGQHFGIWKGRVLSAVQRSALWNGGAGFDPTA